MYEDQYPDSGDQSFLESLFSPFENLFSGDNGFVDAIGTKSSRWKFWRFFRSRFKRSNSTHARQRSSTHVAGRGRIRRMLSFLFDSVIKNAGMDDEIQRQRYQGIIGRCVEWIMGRNYRALLEGFPAIAATTAAIVLTVMVFRLNAEENIETYKHALTDGAKARDPAAATLILERLALLDPDQPEYRYQWALAVRLQGKFDRAMSLLSSIAPLDHAGFAPAHLVIAQRLLDNQPTPETMRIAEIHLRRALERQPDSEDALSMLGQLYFAQGKYKEAERYLLQVVIARPELTLCLAQMYSAMGNKQSMEVNARRAQKFFRERVDASVDDHASRMNWARMTLLLGDGPTAISILQEGLRLSGEQGYRRALGQAYVAWTDALVKAGNGNVGQCLTLLEQGIRHDYTNPALIDRLLVLCRAKEPEAGKVRGTLRQLLAEGVAVSTVNLILGADARERGRLEEARQHFERAFALAPEMPIVINNLAWSLAFSENPDLQRSLGLIESALQRWPNQLNFRETRGQILIKLGRWKEALSDLEAALPALPQNQALHQALAETYRNLNMPEMAETHAGKAKSLGKTATLK